MGRIFMRCKMDKIEMLTGEIRYLLTIKHKHVDHAEKVRIQKRIDSNWLLIEYLLTNKGE